MIKFSIGIPAYKAKYLEECINSVLDQTYTDFEVIIINDKSPEALKDIIKKYNDPRITYYENDFNIGAENVVDNWNKCLEYAEGEFFILLGDDDILNPNYLSEFIKLMNKYPELDIYHCRSLIIGNDSQPINITPALPCFENLYEFIWHRINKHRIQFISDFVYRTVTLKKNKGFYKLPLAWGSDDISAYIACGSKGIAHTNCTVFEYRSSDITITNTGNLELKLKAILLEEEWFKQFLKNTPMPVDFSNKFYNGILLNNISLYFRNKKRRIIFQIVKIKQWKQLFSIVNNLKALGVSRRDFILSVLGKIE